MEQIDERINLKLVSYIYRSFTVAYRGRGCGGGLGCSTPPPEIPKTLQNRAKHNPIVKNVQNC